MFLLLNTEIVPKQIRSFQFTADIIDTIGNRFLEIVLPIPKNNKEALDTSFEVQQMLTDRVKYKAIIKQFPLLMEESLRNGATDNFSEFLSKDLDEILEEMIQDTITLEFGDFSTFSICSSEIKNSIIIPKYYDPSIYDELHDLEKNCELRTIGELIKSGILSLSTGDEIGKMAYGTSTIPFLRTSDFSNWEIKIDVKQGISEEIYNLYKDKEGVQSEDILLVRDGTYLVGSSCMITQYDSKSLFSGGLYKIRTNDSSYLPSYLLLGLLNSYIVKRQIRTKQFTREVIDTIGKRLNEVLLPIPKSDQMKKIISQQVEDIVQKRIEARENIFSSAIDLTNF